MRPHLFHQPGDVRVFEGHAFIVEAAVHLTTLLHPPCILSTFLQPSGDVRVFESHALIVEAAVSLNTSSATSCVTHSHRPAFPD